MIVVTDKDMDTPQQRGSAASAGQLPTELIVAIGHLLDGHSLVTSLRVCHHWHNALIPVVWHSITQTQWQHPAFPIQQPRGQRQPQSEQDPFTGQLPPTLFQVRQLEWVCNASESGDRFSSSGNRPNPLTTATLARILDAMPNLATLSLQVWVLTPDLAFGYALQKLKRLRRLSYDVRTFSTFPIEELFLLFSRLDELVVSSRAWEKTRPEELNDTGASLSPTTAAQDLWKLKKLGIARGNLPVLRHCSDKTLRDLVIRREHMISNHIDASDSFLPILRFSHLDSIRLPIESSPGQQEDVVLVLSSLRQARELVLDVSAFSDLDFLNSPPTIFASARQQPLIPEQWIQRQQQQVIGQGDTADGGEVGDDGLMVLPRLEHLTINFIRPLVVHTRLTTFRRLMMTRPRLRTFVVTNYDVDPDILFEQSRVRAERDGWVCRDLETLSLSFPKGIYSKTADGRNYTWQSIYGQIGKLTKLKSLSLRCVGLQRNVEAGFKQLAGVTCLQELTMIDVRFLKWTEEEVELLLPLVPKLKTFSMGPLQDADFLSVATWLVDNSRPDVRLVR
ncbi:hypothetical protein KI688_000662 [Linnemannia hyalina]|uniref:F-box domain-containing protein n=1 Tax=Linnemannia hyalina TaxID=64524 RepID=A0A9P8BYW5_9FUNG|nr:hypothetical protein KI688_000662 [Linnemannia hyalina]